MPGSSRYVNGVQFFNRNQVYERGAFSTTNYQKHSLKYKGVSIWNNLPKSIKEIKTFNLFRKTLKRFFSASKKIRISLISLI